MTGNRPAANDNDLDYPFKGKTSPFIGFQKEALLGGLTADQIEVVRHAPPLGP